MNKISTSTLGIIAIGVTLGGTGTLYATRWKLQSNIRKSSTYEEALQYFRSNANAIEIFGNPVKEGDVDVGNNKHYGCKDNVMWVGVPLMGRKHSGYLHYWVTTDPKMNKFWISKVELEIAGTKKDRITLMKDEIKESAPKQ